MEREHTLETLTKGKPIAKEYEKLRSKFESARLPIYLSGMILTIFFIIFWLVIYAKDTNGTFLDVWGF